MKINIGKDKMTEQKVVFIAGSSVSQTKIQNPEGIGSSSTPLKVFRAYCKGNLANLMGEGREKVLRYCLVFVELMVRTVICLIGCPDFAKTNETICFT